MKNKLRYIPFFLILYLSFFSFYGCNDKPTDLGYNLLFDTINFGTAAAPPINMITGCRTYYSKQRSAGLIYIGKTTDAQAVSIVRFRESNLQNDSLLYLQTSNINSVTLTMLPIRYAYGDTNSSNLSFKIYKTIKYWSNITTWDSLFAPDGSSTFYDDSKVIGSYSGAITLQDTMSNIRIPIDGDFVVDWIQKRQKDTANRIPIWGLAFIPDNNSNVINQFNTNPLGDSLSFSNSFITVVYTDKNNKIDTLYINSILEGSYFKVNQPDTTSLTLQGAVSYRGQLFFDMSMLPNLASIYMAQLEFTLDRNNSYYANYGLDTLLTLGIPSSNLDSVPIRTYVASRQRGSDLFVVPSITSAVEYWLRNGSKGSLIIYPYDLTSELDKMDRLAFFGPNYPDSTKRPKLKIIYSTRPKK